MVEQSDFNFAKALSDTFQLIDSTEQTTFFWTENPDIIAILFFIVVFLGFIIVIPLSVFLIFKIIFKK